MAKYTIAVDRMKEREADSTYHVWHSESRQSLRKSISEKVKEY